ncbi:ParA family protein [bacterium]|nr:ParA family protein [bacterium]
MRTLPLLGWVYRASKMMIVMTNTKGGVGKSTLAAHLAIWLFTHRRKVALLDTDEQATAAGWIERAEKGDHGRKGHDGRCHPPGIQETSRQPRVHCRR